MTRLRLDQLAPLALAVTGLCGAAPAQQLLPVTELRVRVESTLFVPDPLPDLQPQTYGSFSPATDVIAERVSYATAYGLRVPTIVYRPAVPPVRKMPGLVVVNGHGGDKYSWYAFYAGVLYAKAGAVVVTYDPIGEGERNAQRKSGTRQHDRNIDPPEMGRRMGGLMATDAMQAVSYLRARADVDPQRIAAAGYSMGSFVLGITCAVDPRIRACVLAGGGNLDGPGGYWDSSSKKMCQSIPYQSLLFLGDRGAVLYAMHAERGPTLIVNGSEDDVVRMPDTGAVFFNELRKRVVELRRNGKDVFTYEFVDGGGHRPYFLTQPAAVWLHRQLRFPLWSEREPEKMAVVKVGDWAAKNRVAMDRLYATDLREGGTPALDAQVPGIARELLHALPADEWEREKARYVYESWVSAAEAAVGKR